jgi:hypothetical protein
MKSLRELLPDICLDFAKMVMDCAKNETPAGTAYQAANGRRICVYVVPADFEKDVDALIASKAGQTMVVSVEKIGGGP